MKTRARFAYAHARIQARFARLPTDTDWQRLTGVRGLAGFLEEARVAALRDWIEPFSGQSDTHDIEIGLRALFRQQVDEVAGWVPEPWSGAVRWLRWLVLLPFFDHLSRGGEIPAWVGRDQDLQALLGEEGVLDPERLRRAGASGLLVPGGDPAVVWLDEWRRRRPPCAPEVRRNLAALETLFVRHLTDFRQAPPELAGDLRRRLRERLGLLFHQRLLQPAGAFIYLALVLLELERLRSELVRRALFADAEAA